MLFIGVKGGIFNVRYPAGAAVVCLLAAVLCGSPVTVCPYPMSTASGLLCCVCPLSFVSVVISVSSPLCVCLYLYSF